MAAAWPTLVNGVPADTLPVTNRGLAYGDGLFETMLLHAGEAPLLERHMQRLQRGCERLGLAPDIEALTRQIEALCDNLADRDWCIAKLIVLRRSDGRGYQPSTAACDTVLTTAAGAPPWDAEQWRDGVRAAFLNFNYVPNPVLAGIKHLNRLEQVLAAAEVRERGVDEGLICASDEQLVGCTAATLFYRCDKRLIQVHHPACGVDGTMADHLGMVSRSAGLGTVEKRTVSVADLAAASEIFCCNAVRGIWPIAELDGRKMEIGAATRTLQARLQSELTL